MSLSASQDLINATTAPGLAAYRNNASIRRVDHEIEIDSSKLDTESLLDLIDAATKMRDTKVARALESIARAREGRFDKPVPNFKAFKGTLEAYLKADLIDGWIYVTGNDGKLYPQLITSVSSDSGAHSRNGVPSVRIHTTAYGFALDGNYKHRFATFNASHVFFPGEVANRRLPEILAANGLYKETPELRADHLASLERHRKVTQNAFTQQFRVDGLPLRHEDGDRERRGEEFSNRRVIHDLAPKDQGPIHLHGESFLFEEPYRDEGVGKIPEHPVVRVFDLRTHEFFWVHADNMTPYVYDKSLREKMVLPRTHRDLLDVLTTDLSAFVEDFVEGKSAGNVILCKGIPGVGKTLTAEVYAELMERPLYSIHSGELGTTAADIESNLSVIFKRAKRWGCVLLLDEADVFVVQRGTNIEQNAIVAEFLRTLEYFDGLLFMTTNRPNDIDEAIISRCAAIIDYAAPTDADASAIWRVMATQYQADLNEDVIRQLVNGFPGIAPRDIKMLLRLALRVAAAENKPLDLDTFRRCAMFRAIDMRN